MCSFWFRNTDCIFKIVEQRSAILNVPNEVQIGQFADHKEIARFSSVDDRNYRPVVTRLLKFKQDIHKKLTLLTDGAHDEKQGTTPDASFHMTYTDDMISSYSRFIPYL